MSSGTKPLSTLAAMAAHTFGKKKSQGAMRGGAPARGPTGTTTPMQTGLDAHLNFGMGHGHSFFSTMPLMGHAMSGTQLGANHFADGGKVAPGPNAKERQKIRDMIERGKDDAIAALRSQRDQLVNKAPAPASPDDFSAPLGQLQQRLAMADGGEVGEAEASPQAGDPTQMYQEYMDMLAELQAPGLDPQKQGLLIDRMSQIESELESMGIDVGAGESPS